MRNVFENNENESPESNAKIHSLLPPPAEGYRYELIQWTDGRIAVVLEKDAPETEADRLRQALYGRHKL